MNKLANILGIDIGTSSLKMLYHDGKALHKVRVPYEASGVKGWWEAVCIGAGQLDLRELRGIGLSSQVGTYIVDEDIVIGWQDGAGKEELGEGIKRRMHQRAEYAASRAQFLSIPPITLYQKAFSGCSNGLSA